MTQSLEPPGTHSEPTPNDSLRALIDRTYVGPAVLLCVALLSVVLVGGSSPQYGLGFTAGKAVTSMALALPVYLIFRYFTPLGRRLRRREKLNVLCLLSVALWGLQLLLYAALPGFIAGLDSGPSAPSRAQPSAKRSDSSVPRLPDGSVDWSQFTPVDRPKSAVGCQDSGNQLKNCVCVRNVEGRKLEPWQLPWHEPSKLASLIAQCVCGGVQVDLNDQSCAKAVLLPGTTVQ